MRLLFDLNLSRRLVQMLRDAFPGSVHVVDVGLDEADDREIWQYAAEHDLIVTSKDSDFRHWRSCTDRHRRSFGSGSGTRRRRPSPTRSSTTWRRSSSSSPTRTRRCWCFRRSPTSSVARPQSRRVAVALTPSPNAGWVGSDMGQVPLCGGKVSSSTEPSDGVGLPPAGRPAADRPAPVSGSGGLAPES